MLWAAIIAALIGLTTVVACSSSPGGAIDPAARWDESSWDSANWQ
jgi:hypothetical protein